MAREKSHVALTKCFYCNADDKILLATRYTHKGEPVNDLSPAHGKVLDMDPCNKCKELMGQGVILITIDNAKSQANWHKPVSYTHLRAHETPEHLVCRL